MSQKRRESASDWLLLETFTAPNSASVIAQGLTTKSFVPLDKIIRSATHRAIAEAALASIRERAYPRDFVQGGTRYIFRPLQDYSGTLTAILFHYGADSAPVPDPPECGAWSFDLQTGLATGSEEMHNLHQMPTDRRFQARPIHESLARIVGPDPEATAKLIQKTPGVTHQATETITSEDGSQWVAAYSAGFVENPDGSIVVHGVTRRIGDYQPTSNAPTPADLSAQIVRAASSPDLFRTIVDPTTGTFLRSYDPPPVSGAQNVRHLVHDDDDAATLLRLIHTCARRNIPVTSLTFRGPDQQLIDVTLFPIELDDIRGVLASFRRPI